MIDPRRIHEAMQNAPYDGKDYRQARAAILAVERALSPAVTTIESEVAILAETLERLRTDLREAREQNVQLTEYVSALSKVKGAST